jgi:hypothetical protein
VATAYCLLKNYKLYHPDKGDIQCIKAIQTNGHEWCLFEVHEDYVKKTTVFKPNMIARPKNYTPKIFDDFEHLKAVLGLIRYGLSKLLNNKSQILKITWCSNLLIIL